MTDKKWILKTRDYELDLVKFRLKLNPLSEGKDPLTGDISRIEVKTNKYVLKGNIKMTVLSSNPLEAKGNKKMIDPLSSNAFQVKKTEQKQEQTSSSKKELITTTPTPIPTIITQNKFLGLSLLMSTNFSLNSDSLDSNWMFIKKNLMDLFCSNFSLEVKSIYSFNLNEEDEIQKAYKIETGRCRLEELEESGKKKRVNVLSSGEYVAKMEVLKREMLQKWEIEDKVGTLKIIIHCTKMLNDVFTPKFYTHKFLIISDILDHFSKIIFERIHKLAFNKDLQMEFSEIIPNFVNQTAKDICNNWLLKCSCIRELLPRIYIDISFLKILKFVLNERELENKINVIAKIMRGISHPLISFYVSMYLAKVGSNLFPKYKQYLLILLENLSKFILNEETVKKFNYDITSEELKKIVEPCIEWIIYSLARNPSSANFTNLMKIYDESKNYFILKYIIVHFGIKFVFNSEYIKYIFACSELYENNEAINLYLIICNKMLYNNTSIDNILITNMWDKIKKSKSKITFIDGSNLIADILIKFNLEEILEKFFEEVFDIFKTTINPTTIVSEETIFFHKFELFLYNTLTKMNNYSNILNVDNFLFLLENFNEDIKLNICRTIMNQVVLNSESKISDPYLAFSLLKVGKYLHDSIEIKSTEQQRQEISDVLNKFIRKIDFGIDFENHLNILTEARGVFSELDEVIETLVLEVHRICINTHNIVKGKHNQKTLRFCKVCVAYCQITIPSIKNLFTQLRLSLWTAQIALINNLISESDSLVKNCITVLSKTINESNRIEKSDFQFLKEFAGNLNSFLIIVPSNPESPFQLVTGILNIFSEKNFDSQTFQIKLLLQISLLKYISTQLQIKLPYHISNVDSNDEIFTKDEIFRKEAQDLLDTIVNDVLNDISEYDSKLSSNDLVEYEFLINHCLLCGYNFFKIFENTKYRNSVIKKMIELSQNYLEHIKRTFRNLEKEKINFFTNYIARIKTLIE